MAERAASAAAEARSGTVPPTSSVSAPVREWACRRRRQHNARVVDLVAFERQRDGHPGQGPKSP